MIIFSGRQYFTSIFMKYCIKILRDVERYTKSKLYKVTVYSFTYDT